MIEFQHVCKTYHVAKRTVQIKSQMQYKVSFLLSAFGQFLSAFTFCLGINFVFAKITRVDTFTYERNPVDGNEDLCAVLDDI